MRARHHLLTSPFSYSAIALLPLSLLLACAEVSDGGAGLVGSSRDTGLGGMRSVPSPPAGNDDSADAGVDAGQDVDSGSDRVDTGGGGSELDLGGRETSDTGLPGADEPDVGNGQDDVNDATPEVVVIPPDAQCSDTCETAFDGECDDGGADALYDSCARGTDCFDCGPREGTGGGTGDAELCTDTCTYDHDGDCDDGGPGSDYSFCALGTDCFDCGPRDGSGGGEGLCTDTCFYFADGDCDDGGPGSDFSLCDLGTDCTDCGPR